MMKTIILVAALATVAVATPAYDTVEAVVPVSYIQTIPVNNHPIAPGVSSVYSTHGVYRSGYHGSGGLSNLGYSVGNYGYGQGYGYPYGGVYPYGINQHTQHSTIGIHH